jgi:hypothetical protein
MLKFAIAGALGAALSFLGTFGLAQEAPPAHWRPIRRSSRMHHA